MRSLRLIMAIAVPLVAVLVASPASAGCEWVQTEQMVSGTIRIKTERICTSESSGGAGQPVSLPPRDSDLDSVCVRTALELGVAPAPYCDSPPDAADPTAPVLTRGAVARAFREIPLPAADLIIQPPHGRTLVNFETNFYTEQGEFTRTVRLLGRQVELRIWPASFHWRFGDGQSRETTEPGAAYPDLQVTHQYTRKGRVAPSVDTTYAAQFRVDGGPWRDVAGTVMIPGSPQALRVVEARPVLVGG